MEQSIESTLRGTDGELRPGPSDVRIFFIIHIPYVGGVTRSRYHQNKESVTYLSAWQVLRNKTT